MRRLGPRANGEVGCVRIAPVAGACLCLTLAGATTEAQSRAQAAPERHLVIPFENETREGRSYWLSEASAIILTDDLSALGAPVISRDDRMLAQERLRVPMVASLSHATVIRLGQVLGAQQVVLGGFALAGTELVVRARAIRLDTGRMAPEIVEKGPLSGLFEVFVRVARRLAPDSRTTIEEMERSRPPLAAFEDYVKGLVAGDPATKIAFLNQALARYPGMHQARLALWRVHAEQGDHQAALAVAVGVPPGHGRFREARFLGAVSLLSIGMFSEAHARFTELNRATPDSALLNNLGVVQLRRPIGAPGGAAVDYFRQAAALDPNDADIFFNLGYASWLARNAQDAISGLREAVRRNPADEEAHYVLGVALQASGSSAEAAREKELAKRLSSVFEEWETKQSGVDVVPRGLERLKTEIDVSASMRVEDVIVAAEQRDQRQLAAFHLDAGTRLFQAERDVEAIAELRRAVYLSPYESRAHLLLGRAYLRRGLMQEAVAAFKISIWSDDTIPTRLALAEAYVAGREYAAARTELQGILKREPTNPDARALLERLPPS